MRIKSRGQVQGENPGGKSRGKVQGGSPAGNSRGKLSGKVQGESPGPRTSDSSVFGDAEYTPLLFFVKLSSILQEKLIRVYSALNTLW